MENFTGVRFDSELGEFEVIVCGEVEGHGNTAREAAAKLQECITWRATVASKTQPRKSVYQRDDAPQHAEKPARVIVPAKCASGAQRVTAAPRCPFYKSIRYCFAVARDAGLDCKADDAMCAAFAAFLGRAVPSRETLNGRDWLAVGNAIKSKKLAW